MNEDAGEINGHAKSPSPDPETVTERNDNENGVDGSPSSTEELALKQRNDNKIETNDSQGDDMYLISSDQRQAMLELDMRDGMGDYSEPPDYDVKERIQQLNSELERVPTPDEDEREHKVNFKDELVDLIAPPPEYTTDEDTESSSAHQSPRPIVAPPEEDIKEESEEAESKQVSNVPDSQSTPPEAAEPPDETALSPEPTIAAPKMEVSDTGTVEPESPIDKEPDPSTKEEAAEVIEGDTSEPNVEPESSETAQVEQQEEKQGEKVLVERGGEFHVEFVESGNENVVSNAEDGENEDVEEEVPEAGHSRGSSSSSDSDSDDDNRGRSRSSRPISAPAPSSSKDSGSNARPVSAYHSSSINDEPASGYSSPYGLSSSEKTQRQRRIDEKNKRLREIENRKKEDEAQRRKNAEEAFNAWLRQKRDESIRQKQREQEQKEEESRLLSSESSSDEHFKNWLSKKREQMKQERELEIRERDDYRKGICIRSREDCERAFKEWIRRKNREAATERNIERQRARLTRLALRRSRKSQALARAIHQANAFRYVDYYGYRF